MTTLDPIKWYEKEIQDAEKWLAYFEDKELPTCAAVERVRLRRLQEELSALKAQEETS